MLALCKKNLYDGEVLKFEQGEEYSFYDMSYENLKQYYAFAKDGSINHFVDSDHIGVPFSLYFTWLVK